MTCSAGHACCDYSGGNSHDHFLEPEDCNRCQPTVPLEVPGALCTACDGDGWRFMPCGRHRAACSTCEGSGRVEDNGSDPWGGPS